jgi:DNA-directed RNA polymerase specialized sigma24 family protein
MTAPPPGDVDARLLRAISNRDQAALQTLYERHSAWLFARLIRRCSDEDLVADVLQDTFLAVWRGAGRWRGDGDVAAWIWGISIRGWCRDFAAAGCRSPCPKTTSRRPRTASYPRRSPFCLVSNTAM